MERDELTSLLHHGLRNTSGILKGTILLASYNLGTKIYTQRWSYSIVHIKQDWEALIIQHRDMEYS